MAAAVLAGAPAMPVSFSVLGAAVGFFWFEPPLPVIQGVRDILQQDGADIRARREDTHDGGGDRAPVG